MSWLSEEIKRLQAASAAHVWVSPEGDEIVYQATENGPLIAVNEYGRDEMRGDEPPEGWDEMVEPEGGR